MSITRCPHCGTANRAGSNFCNGCGTDLRESLTLEEIAAAAAAAETQAEPTPPVVTPLPADSPAPPVTPPIAPLSSPPPAGNDFRDQPWLSLEFAGEDEQSLDADLDVEPDFDDSGRLVTAVQGLLAPIRIASNITDDTPIPPRPSPPTIDALSNDELRLIRGLMSEQPALVNYQVRTAMRPPRTLRIGWIFALLGLAIGLPAIFYLGGPVGTPNRWNGVEESYLTIQGIAPNTLVVLYWAYDPATSGEIDLAMQPVMRHLLQRRARLAIVTTLPGGIASAERLIAQVRAGQGNENLALAADLGQPIPYSYLPGGAALLPLLARDPARALLENIMVAAPEERQDLVPTPALIVSAAADSEHVQQWLEQVQVLNGVPVVAVTSAGADPMLRPYLDSSQLSGLVSGFDGAYSYRKLLDPYLPPETDITLWRQIILQNWGQIALLAVIALGNLAALLGRDGGA